MSRANGYYHRIRHRPLSIVHIPCRIAARFFTIARHPLDHCITIRGVFHNFSTILRPIRDSIVTIARSRHTIQNSRAVLRHLVPRLCPGSPPLSPRTDRRPGGPAWCSDGRATACAQAVRNGDRAWIVDFSGRQIYCTRPILTLTRSVSEGRNAFPRLRFGLV